MSESTHAARREFERELNEVKRTLADEFGWSPRGARWLIPVSAIVAGVVGALAVRRRYRRSSSCGTRPRQQRRWFQRHGDR